MDPVKKNKSLVGIIIFLLVSNIAMLVFFLVLGNSQGKKDHTARKDMIATFLKKDMGFDQKQMDQYDTSHKVHMEKMKPFFEAVHAAKDNFYDLLYKDEPDSLVSKSALVIGEKQTELDIQMFKHLKNVRNICTPEQLPRFDSSFKTVMAKMTQHRKPDSKQNK